MEQRLAATRTSRRRRWRRTSSRSARRWARRAHRDRAEVRLPVRACRCASCARRPARSLLAVLPFENLSGDAEQEYFSDGLTDEMITQLGRLNPERARRHRAHVGDEVQAHAGRRSRRSAGSWASRIVVEGSVRRAGARVRVTAQLMQVADQTHVWAQSYDRDFDDILVLQSDIAQAIAREIKIKLTPRRGEAAGQRRPSARRPTRHISKGGTSGTSAPKTR